MAKASSEGKQTLVVVESPTKARTIRKFLGKNYIVESCMGHVRDLPQSAKDIPEKFKKQPWANLGVNVEQDFEPIYCIPKTKTRIVKSLKDQLKDTEELILATDEDREGESISWHLIEVLKPKVPVKRMVFHEITKEAINKALKETRDLDLNLVRAQEARRILDRLVGYTISPLLWKKVAYGLSAGRVQSVAVRLISEREHERLRFVKSDYWSLSSKNSHDKIDFESKIQSYDGKKVAVGKDFDSRTGKLLADKANEVLQLDEKKAQQLLEELKNQKWTVSEVVEKPVSRKPSPPFITSTLQQEANRKLGFSSRETMELAQKLYERGLITYMRTDSTNLSGQAIDAARSCIKSLYGKDYLPEEPRLYSKKKVKGAQEAHEAIRPAGSEFVHPDDSKLSGGQYKLYDLIWKRTVASQMVNSQHKQVSVKFEVGDAVFSTSGMTIEFPGFLKAYVEGKDDPEAALDNREVRLPKMKVGDQVKCSSMTTNSHETKPPARFTEATLVQTMEKEGIGRPSTYAAIIGTIQDRGYVKKVGNALIPTFTALVVSKLLGQHLPDYVDLGFTSSMENQLDEIADGDKDSQEYLKQVYFGQKGLKSQVEKQEELIDNETSRSIELVGLKDLSFRIGRYGAYVCRVMKETGEEVCASLPENHYPGDITEDMANKLIDQKINGTDALGKDPETGKPIYVLTGRYGPYVQLGEDEGSKAEEKPKRMSVPPTMDPENLSLEQALKLLELPKTLGEHPETGKVIKKGLGRFGPYVVHDGDFRSIPKTENLFDVDLKKALELLAQPKRTRGRAAPLKELGEHPKTGDAVAVYDGKYGPYVKCGKVNASLPEDIKPEDLTLAAAVEILADKIDSVGKKKTAKKKSAKKSATKTVSGVNKKASKVKKKSSAKAETAKKAAKKTTVIRRTARS
ncbi:MAG: type I DNA topoisomerase [Bdellovibrionales bacterium]|nr:type I DNA topoisomerase [Bdellovibrionales bacterium]